MAKEFSKKFYSSKAWKNAREEVISRCFGICELCGKRQGKIVHHIIHLNNENISDVSISLNQDNLMFLCKDCHELVHKSNCSQAGRLLEFDDDGNVIEVHDNSNIEK